MALFLQFQAFLRRLDLDRQISQVYSDFSGPSYAVPLTWLQNPMELLHRAGHPGVLCTPFFRLVIPEEMEFAKLNGLF
jgi:hypothetical protein